MNYLLVVVTFQVYENVKVGIPMVVEIPKDGSYFYESCSSDLTFLKKIAFRNNSF